MLYVVPANIAKVDSTAASEGSLSGAPTWFFELLMTLEDGASHTFRGAFTVSLSHRAQRWHVLTDAKWDRLRRCYLRICVSYALEWAAESYPNPRYLCAIHRQARRDLIRDKGSKALAKKASAVIWKATRAGLPRAAAAAAAIQAVARRQATEAAEWAAEAGASAPARYDRLAGALFMLLDAELTGA